MTITNDFKCKICGNVTRIRYEVASDSCSFHSYVPCKNCKTMFYGEYVQNDLEVKAKIEYKNAIRVEHEKPDYVCTISSDFISRKVKDVCDEKDMIDVPMWMRFKDILGFKEYFTIFKERVPALLNVYSNSRHEWSNIMELWFNSEITYLDLQLRDLFDEDNNISDTQRLSLIRKVGIMVFLPLYREEISNDSTKKYKQKLGDIYKNKPKRLNDYLKEMDSKNQFIELEKIIYNQLKRALVYIPNLIPIMSIDYFSDEDKNIIFDENFDFGIYSFEFDEIKQLYQDLFETHVKLLHFFVGLDNLVSRGDYNKFKNGSKYTNLNKFESEFTAYKKIDEIEVSTAFCSETKKYLDNHMRNMIGHCSYELNPVTQLIKYKNGEITLVEIAHYCYHLILELCNNFQVVTILHELFLSGQLDQ